MGERWPPGDGCAAAGLPFTLRVGAPAAAPQAGTPPPCGGTSLPGADALTLFASVLAAGDASAAAQGLVAAVAARLAAGRASLGLRERGRTVLVARTDAAPSELATAAHGDAIIGAMDEAWDQGVAQAWPVADADQVVHGADLPPPSGPNSPPGDPLCFELRQLHAAAGAAVAVAPIGRDGEPLAALCLERPAGPPFTRAELEHATQWLVLAAPALVWMRRAQAPLHLRARQALRAGVERLRRPDRRTHRRLLAASSAVLAFLALAPLTHDIGGRARLEGAEQRLLAAPSDGFVKAAHVLPGDTVRAGQPLVDLQEDELQLERERWRSQLAQHENAYAAAMAQSDRVGAATAMARVAESQSQMALVDDRLARGRLVAPFDGVVIAGDLSRSIGAPVRQGDTLVTLATGGRHRVIVDIDEVDIARVHPGQAGWLSLSALPWDREQIVVERIAPMARAVEGRNVFEVDARLVTPHDGLRPGLVGRASIEVGRRPPLWAWLGHAAARLRMAWWAWLG